MSKATPLVLLALLGAFTAGCGSKEAVSLAGSIDDTSLVVDQNAVGTYLSGSFSMNLRLGKFASDPVTVEAPSFALVDGESRVDLGLGPLSAAPDRSFPFDLDPGGEVAVGFELSGDDPVGDDPAAALDALCSAPVVVAATVQHSLDGGSTTTVRSAPTTPDGCP